MKIKVTVETKYAGSRDTEVLDVDDEEWNDMTEGDREKMCREAMFGMIGWSYEEQE